MQVTGSVLGEGGEPLGGVAVSDGRGWAVTRGDGSFALASVPGRPVWARRPETWPGGRWWGHPRPGRSLMLRLQPRPGAGGSSPRPAARIAHLTDPHVSGLDGHPAGLAVRYGDRTDTLGGLRRALAAAAAAGAGLAVITGDLTDHGTPAEFQLVTELIAAAPLPVEVVPGNHDHCGHRYEPDRDDVPRGGGFLGSATVTRYEQAMGPRWWSADLAGVHVVALDWFSAWCGIDAAEQQRFVAADLATRAPGLPVLVLAHDQPGGDTLALLQQGAGPLGLLAVVTGHWHADAQRAVGGCHFLSTPAVAFGGLDWSPPQWRMITISWQEASVHLRHHAVRTVAAQPPARRHGQPPAGAIIASDQLGESQHLGALAADCGTVLAPATAGDGGGLVSRIHPVAGLTWTARAAGEPVTGIRVAPGQVLVSSTAGRLVALDAGTGEQRWAYQLPGRRQRRLLTAPLVTPAGQVITGDIGAVACLDLPSGGLRWEVSGPGSPDTLLTYGTGLVTPQLAVLPFGGPGLGLTALHLADASLAWTDPPGTPPPSSSLVPIGDGDALLLRTATPSLERLDLATGRVRWRTPLHGRYSTAAPLVTEHAITLVTGDGIVHYLHRDTGEITTHYPLHGLREAYGPYRSAWPRGADRAGAHR